jgi:hypothetical protein
LGARHDGELGGGGGRPSTVGGRTSVVNEPGRPTGEVADRASPRGLAPSVDSAPGRSPLRSPGGTAASCTSRLGHGVDHGPVGSVVGAGSDSVVPRSCSRPGVPEAGGGGESEVDASSTSAACARNRWKIARPRSAEPSEGGGVVTAPWWPPKRPGSSTTKSHRSRRPPIQGREERSPLDRRAGSLGPTSPGSAIPRRRR